MSLYVSCSLFVVFFPVYFVQVFVLFDVRLNLYDSIALTRYFLICTCGRIMIMYPETIRNSVFTGYEGVDIDIFLNFFWSSMSVIRSRVSSYFFIYFLDIPIVWLTVIILPPSVSNICRTIVSMVFYKCCWIILIFNRCTSSLSLQPLHTAFR